MLCFLCVWLSWWSWCLTTARVPIIKISAQKFIWSVWFEVQLLYWGSVNAFHTFRMRLSSNTAGNVWNTDLLRHVTLRPAEIIFLPPVPKTQALFKQPCTLVFASYALTFTHVKILFWLQGWIEQAAVLSRRQLDPDSTHSHAHMHNLSSQTHISALYSVQSVLPRQPVTAIQWNVKALRPTTHHARSEKVYLMLFRHTWHSSNGSMSAWVCLRLIALHRACRASLLSN